MKREAEQCRRHEALRHLENPAWAQQATGGSTDNSQISKAVLKAQYAWTRLRRLRLIAGAGLCDADCSTVENGSARHAAGVESAGP
jgi:hypothetical protein